MNYSALAEKPTDKSVYGKFTVKQGDFMILKDEQGVIFLRIANKGGCTGTYTLTYGATFFGIVEPMNFSTTPTSFSMGQNVLAKVSCKNSDQVLLVEIVLPKRK